MKSIKKRIKELENKIKEFGAKYSGDALTSYNEATQAALTVEVYKKQLDDLKKQKVNDTNVVNRKFYLKGGKELILTVSSSMIDPEKRIISENSKIGKILLNSSLGDKITIGENNFILEKVENIE